MIAPRARRPLAIALAAAVLALAPSARAADSPAGGDAGSVAAGWLAGATPVEGLGRPTGPWALDLPADHGPHPDAAADLWQLSVHLRTADGTPAGLQLSILRLGLVPPDAAAPLTDGALDAPWRARALYRGHVTLLPPSATAALGEERLGRDFAGLAGFDPETRELRLDGWALRFAGEGWRLEAAAGPVGATLTLTPERAPRALGAEAEEAPARGYSLSRLAVTGQMEAAAGAVPVTGTAWFDHLWGELPLPGAAPVVADVLQLQLDDGSELSVVRQRRQDGRGAPTLDALRIAPDGTVSAVAEAEATPAAPWQAPDGRHWPLAWDLRLDDLALTVTPVVPAQAHDFAVPLWSGLVQAEGAAGGRPITGLGTLQLTGEATP